MSIEKLISLLTSFTTGFSNNFPVVFIITMEIRECEQCGKIVEGDSKSHAESLLHEHQAEHSSKRMSVKDKIKSRKNKNT